MFLKQLIAIFLCQRLIAGVEQELCFIINKYHLSVFREEYDSIGRLIEY